MIKPYISFILVFLVSFLITVFGVTFFFKPIADAEQLRLSMPSIVGFIYILMCAVIYMWAYKETRSSYKAAIIVVIPQTVLIIDLMLRGERGPVTALAGSALLFVTWLCTAIVHQQYLKKIA